MNKEKLQFKHHFFLDKTQLKWSYKLKQQVLVRESRVRILEGQASVQLNLEDATVGLSGDPRDTRLIDRIFLFLVLDCGFSLQIYLCCNDQYCLNLPINSP